MMFRSRLFALWKRFRIASDRVFREYFGFNRSSVWLRFLLLPILAVAVFLLSRQLSSLIEIFTDVLVAEPGAPAQSPNIILEWIASVLFPGSELAPPKPGLIEMLLDIASEIGPENLQLALLGGVAFWVAHRVVSMYVHYIYGMTDFQQSKHMVSSAFIPFRRRRAVIENGRERPGTSISIHEMYGGQITLEMDAQKGFSAVMERADHSIRIVGPQDRFPLFLDGFLHLRQIVDLNDQRIQVSVRAHTLDGIPIQLRDAIFIGRISGSAKAARKGHFETCDIDAIRSLTYHHWIGPEWENPAKRRKALHDFISTALGNFISNYPLTEFLPETSEFNALCQSRLDETRLLDRFTRDVATEGENGLELVWTGRGEWRLSEALDIDLIAQHCNQAVANEKNSQPSLFNRHGIAARRDESKKLVRHLLRVFEEAQQSGDANDQVVLKLIRLYADRLQYAIRILEARGEKIPQYWLEAQQHLKQLTR